MPDKEFVSEWMRYATSDWRVARHSIEDLWPRETEISAWHCQQCAEKVLKAFLIANDVDPPKTHNLEDLYELCKNIDIIFSEVKLDCQRINPYGVASRYPNEIAADETIAKPLVGRAQKVYDFCTTKINVIFQE